MADANTDPNLFVKAMAFTKNAHRDVYPAVDPKQPKLSQAGKVIVITGATRGLGRGFAISFAQAKAAAIALLGRSADALAETEKQVKEISPETVVLSLVADVRDEAGINAAFETIVAKCGVPDVLINNAGYLVNEVIGESTVESFWTVQEINVKGVLIVSKAFLKAIEASPEQERTIINLTSTSTQTTGIALDAYTVSKVAVTKLTEFLAAEYPAITSVNLDPGMVATDMGVSVPIIAAFLYDTVELASGAAVWLCSGDRKFLSGRYFLVNWDVEELEVRREEIIAENLLSSGVRRGDKVPAEDELVIHEKTLTVVQTVYH
ncbi:hypothetical protein ASPCAL02965 [Aspergillus calidoustus]|uniref:Ketoreductase domain-containing protein n=1 Tax=Aspergillus calidoustus TaxID=454130 RepID=A0A0U5CNM8_ASPCI|nr:hypothetical protein ASPCAL02965 [Aspergillus calidoustus]